MKQSPLLQQHKSNWLNFGPIPHFSITLFVLHRTKHKKAINFLNSINFISDNLDMIPAAHTESII